MTAPLDSPTKRQLDQYRAELLERLSRLDETIAGLIPLETMGGSGGR
jgi:hypothetical protein